MSWLPYGIIAGIFFAVYNAFLKQSSSHLHALYGSIALSIASVIATLILVLFFKLSGQHMALTEKGLKLAFTAGLFSAFGGMFYFFMFQKKAPLNLGLPLLSVSTVIFSVIIGLIFFQEKLTLLKTIGLLLAGISIFLISM